MVGRAISKYATFLMKQKLEALISMTIRQTEWLLATGEVAWDHAGSRRRVIPNLSLILLTLACAGLRLLRDAPHEANKLPRDCSADDGRFFSRAPSARYRAVRRVCAFHAISLMRGGAASIL